MANQTLKCQSCGAALQPRRLKKIVVCDYCSTKNLCHKRSEAPKVTNEGDELEDHVSDGEIAMVLFVLGGVSLVGVAFLFFLARLWKS